MRAIEFNGDGKDGLFDCSKGVYHLNGTTGMSGYTMCGITLDSDEFTAGSFNAVNAKAINCPSCVSIIKACKGVKTAKLEVEGEPEYLETERTNGGMKLRLDK